jgi:site-specific DNA recombinase
VVRELARRGWATKWWADKTGRVTGGKPFSTSLYQLLTNPLYAGRVRYKADVFPGEHPALVDPRTFDAVQDRLRMNGTQGAGPGSPDRYGAPLKGLLRCGPCAAAAMTPTCTTKGTRTYRYYACVAGHKKGAATCPSKPVPAGPVKGLVVDRVRAAGRDPDLLRQVVAQARQ